jgi:DNA-binding MarR family transcriptional regulator
MTTRSHATAGSDPRLDDIAGACVALHVRMTARAVTRAYDEAMRPTGLKITQFILLSALSTGAWRSVTELAERFALERTSLSRNLQLLVTAGLIEPVECKGRASIYAVTERGRAAIEAAIPHWRAAQERIEGGIGADNWKELRDRLKALRRVTREPT